MRFIHHDFRAARAFLGRLAASGALAAAAPALALAQGSQSVQNPLGSVTFCSLVTKLLQAAMVIGVPVAVLAVVFAGFLFVMARGKPEEIKKAQQNFFYTVIGVAIFFGAAIIAGVIVGTLHQFGVSVVSC